MSIQLNAIVEKVTENINKMVNEKMNSISVLSKEYGVLLENIERSLSLVETVLSIQEKMGDGKPSPKGDSDKTKTQIQKIKDDLKGSEYKGKNGELKDSRLFVSVFFASSGCPVCDKMAPIYFPILERTNIPVEKIDFVDESNRELWHELGITQYPVLLFVEDNIIKQVEVGYSFNVGEQAKAKAHMAKLLDEFL